MSSFYRFEDIKYAAPLDEYDRPIGEGELRVHLREYQVVRETPKGTWIKGPIGEKFVRKKATKHFACPTIEEARESFIARKKRQALIHQTRVNRALKAIEIVKGSPCQQA